MTFAQLANHPTAHTLLYAYNIHSHHAQLGLNNFKQFYWYWSCKVEFCKGDICQLHILNF